MFIKKTDSNLLMTTTIASFDLNSFNHSPKDLMAILDEIADGQRQAKSVLARAVSTHYRRLRDHKTKGVEYDPRTKPNLLLNGQSGTGKTTMVKGLAKQLGLPFVEVNATTLTEAGVVGSNPDDFVKELVYFVAPDNHHLAKIALVFIDEVDFLARPTRGDNFYDGLAERKGLALQKSYLKIMEGVEIVTGKGPISTDYMLFVLAGSFQGLEEIVAKRLGANRIGFGEVKLTSTDLAGLTASTDDYLKFGMDEQFMGRIPLRGHLSPLNSDGLYNLLRLKSNPMIRTFTDDFARDGLTLIFEESGLRAIAAGAAGTKTGARELYRAIDEIVGRFLNLPSGIEVIVDHELVHHPEIAYTQLLELNEKSRRIDAAGSSATSFLNESDRTLNFNSLECDDRAYYRGVLKQAGIVEELLTAAVNNGYQTCNAQKSKDPRDVIKVIDDTKSRIESYAAGFQNRFGKAIEFEPEAVSRIIENSLERGGDVANFIDLKLGFSLDSNRFVISSYSGERIIVKRDYFADNGSLYTSLGKKNNSCGQK